MHRIKHRAPKSAPLVFFGTAEDPGSYDSDFVQALARSVHLNSRVYRTIYEADTEEYCWYAYPASFGGDSTNFIDNATQFEFAMELVDTLDVTFKNGNVVSYKLFRSEFKGFGLVYLKVT